MKAGLTSSILMHVSVLAFGLVTLSAPTPHDVGDVQALPIDIVPIEEMTRLMEGDRTSRETEAPAPRPTARRDTVEDARNAGDNDIDLNDVPKPAPAPRPVDSAAAAPPPEPAPRPQPTPTPVTPAEAPPPPTPKPAEPKVAAAPPPQPAPEPAPVVEAPKPEPQPTPDPVAEAIAAAPAEQPAERMEFPDQLPRPQARPEPPQQVARAETPPQRPARTETPRRQPDRPAEQPSEDLNDLLDQAKALIDKRAPAGGGARREERTAAIGADRSDGSPKLSQSEMDALRQRLGQCWSIPAGVDDASLLKVSVRFRLNRTGELDAQPEVIRGGGGSGPARTAAESALRAVRKCAPFNLPADKYETWAEVVVNFDPTDMF